MKSTRKAVATRRRGRSSTAAVHDGAPHRAGGRGASASPPRVRVRMYRVGLGDCFLLTFQPGTGDEAHVLVDIGTLGRGDGVPLDEVVEDVAETTGRRLRAVVATHEHADHLSGFARLRAANVTADEVWVAWTEDPTDPLARQLARYRGDLFAATERAAAGLDSAQRERRRARAALRDDPVAAGEGERRFALLEALCGGVRGLLAFHGLDAGDDVELAAAFAASGGLKATTDEMMRSALALSPRPPHFWSPGDAFEREWAPGARFYVLGPPRHPAAIQRLGEHGSPDLYELAFVTGARLPAAEAGTPDREAHASWEPFDRAQRVPMDRAAELGPVAAAYEAEGWRRIDEAPLGAAADLALQLDGATNNTSLVLAVELDREVLLFPGDAQLGSWRTWPDVRFTVREGDRERTVRGEQLLRRTTFYKVGHHGSHNATSRPGLELMDERGLTAFIPLDEGVARSRGWHMPARALHERLREKTRGRTVKSDEDATELPGITVARRYVEVTLPSRAGTGARSSEGASR